MNNRGPFSLMRMLRFYSLCIVFLITPIIYSGLYIPGFSAMIYEGLFSVSGIFINGFEKVKVGFFLIFVFIALVASLFQFRTFFIENTKKYWIFVCVFLLWTVLSYFFNQDTNPYFWFGNPEKKHGWFFFFGLTSLFLMVKSSTQNEQKYFIKMSLCSFGIVFLYAFFQKISLDPLSSIYQSRVDSARIFSTLGNPNYLAGYALMFVPFFLQMNNEKGAMNNSGIFLVFGLLIFWTGSILGGLLFLGYLFYHFIIRSGFYRSQNRQQRTKIWLGILLFLGLIFSLVFSIFGEQILALQKMQGFIARWYLWQTGISAIFGSFKSFLVGYGPDGLLAVSEQFRHPLLSVYEDPAFRIDSSHNIFIDIGVQFGVPFLFAFLWYVLRIWSSLSFYSQASLILFSCYFFFNIPALVHFLIILIFIIDTGKKI